MEANPFEARKQKTALLRNAENTESSRRSLPLKTGDERPVRIETARSLCTALNGRWTQGHGEAVCPLCGQLLIICQTIDDLIFMKCAEGCDTRRVLAALHAAGFLIGAAFLIGEWRR